MNSILRQDAGMIMTSPPSASTYGAVWQKCWDDYDLSTFCLYLWSSVAEMLR